LPSETHADDEAALLFAPASPPTPASVCSKAPSQSEL
jgi:hypothetical protein